MKIKMITAYDKNKLIGNDNKLPWHLPEDLRHFKQETQNKNIIMGKNTYLSIGKPLPKRNNIVISSTLENLENYDNLFIFKNIESAMLYLKEKEIEEVIIIGGTSIYKQFLNKVDELIATEIHSEFKGDSYFPDFLLNVDLDKSKYNLVSENNLIYDIIYYKK